MSRTNQHRSRTHLDGAAVKRVVRADFGAAKKVVVEYLCFCVGSLEL